MTAYWSYVKNVNCLILIYITYNQVCYHNNTLQYTFIKHAICIQIIICIRIYIYSIKALRHKPIRNFSYLSSFSEVQK